jgi:hypothetical protein
LPVFDISDDGWTEAERIYGFPIIPDARCRIVKATREYYSDAQLEVDAPSLSETLAEVRKMKLAAQGLHLMLREGLIDQRAAASHRYARHLVMGHLKIPTAPFVADRSTKKEALRALSLNSRALARACGSVLEQSASATSFTHGEAWNMWICRLTIICRSSALPATVRKDSYEPKTRKGTKSGSPFVMFLERLQKFLPEELRLHTQSSQALAVAIVKARASRV